MEFEIDRFEHAGLTVRIGAEQYIEEFFNPRHDVDGLLGVMVTEYRGYTFGGGKNDESGYPDTRVECDRCHGTGEVKVNQHAEKDCERCEGTGELELSLLDWVLHQGARVCLPLFVYEHSGITMSAGGNLLTGEDNFSRKGRYAMDPGEWDTSSVGIIFDTTETREECGWEKRSVEDIEADLKMEVNAKHANQRGDVRYYVIENEEGDMLDSLGGFLIATDEDERYMNVEAKGAAERERKAIEAEKREAANWAARDTVTVNA